MSTVDIGKRSRSIAALKDTVEKFIACAENGDIKNTLVKGVDLIRDAEKVVEVISGTGHGP